MTAMLIAYLSLSAPVLERHARDFEDTVWEYAHAGLTNKKFAIELNRDGTFVIKFCQLKPREGWKKSYQGDGTWTFKNNTLSLHNPRSSNPVIYYHFPGAGKGSARVLEEIGEQKRDIYLRKAK